MSFRFEATQLPQYLTVKAGEPLVFHCNHYNATLQQSIEDAGAKVPWVDILRDSAATPVFKQLSSLFGKGMAPDERMALASEYFRQHGFGLLEAKQLGENGGQATVRNSHYALAFRARGARTVPACFFAAGYIQGMTAAAFGGEPGTYHVEEKTCLAMGQSSCTFEVSRAPKPRKLSGAHGCGTLLEPFPSRTGLTSKVDEQTIIRAVGTLPLSGNEEGQIPGFGLYLTQHYANYYNNVSYGFEDQLKANHPHLAGAAVKLLVESGHVCAFNTFGGIMSSPEWDAVVRPMLAERKDWVFGIIAIVNALGWGRWSVQELQENKRLVVRVDGSYESNTYVATHPPATEPKCYLCQGGVAGIMNLLYVGDITLKPALTTDSYRKLFSGPESFAAVETRCRSKGDAYCEFVAERHRF